MTAPVTRPSLPQVTLVAVTGVAIEATVDALRKSMRHADFAEVLLLSDRAPSALPDPAIKWRRIDRLGSRRDYSRFMLRNLAQHISTSHALCVQWDGFVLDGAGWDPAFLDFDYIGAVWPHFDDGHNVGNGGFSLRSRSLLNLCSNLPADDTTAEDVVIGRLFRPRLESEGIRFAPEAVARRFAFERTPPTGHEFGFHGAYNLVRYVSRREAEALFRDLEPGLLTRSERLEILKWAFARGRWKLAGIMVSRLRAEVDSGRSTRS